MQNNTSPQNNPNQPPLLTTPPVGSTPQIYAQRIVDLTKSSIVILFWVVVGSACIALAIVSFAAIYWLATLAFRALGIS